MGKKKNKQATQQQQHGDGHGDYDEQFEHYHHPAPPHHHHHHMHPRQHHPYQHQDEYNGYGYGYGYDYAHQPSSGPMWPSPHDDGFPHPHPYPHHHHHPPPHEPYHEPHGTPHESMPPVQYQSPMRPKRKFPPIQDLTPEQQAAVRDKYLELIAREFGEDLGTLDTLGRDLEYVGDKMLKVIWAYIDNCQDFHKEHGIPPVDKMKEKQLFIQLSNFTGAISLDFIRAFFAHQKARSRAGIIVLNPPRTHVLLARHPRGNNWGFIQGKINIGETELECALREGKEEVSFDFAPYISEDDCITIEQPDKDTTYFLAFNVPRRWKKQFEAKYQGEIGALRWAKLSSIENVKLSFVPSQTIQPLVDKLKELQSVRRKVNYKLTPRRSKGDEITMPPDWEEPVDTLGPLIAKLKKGLHKS